MLSGEATNTIFIVFGLTLPGMNPRSIELEASTQIKYKLILGENIHTSYMYLVKTFFGLIVFDKPFSNFNKSETKIAHVIIFFPQDETRNFCRGVMVFDSLQQYITTKALWFPPQYN